LLQDPSIINLHGKVALLSHGDNLCTDDVEYQKFRFQVRDAKWQEDFLKLPLIVRKDQIETIRTRSEHEKSQKSMQIMDVNQAAINSLLKTYHYPELIIHGHTHRPNQHHIQLDGHNITRWVLGDWYEQGSYLRCNESGCNAMQL
jgi:UDP-2,3-diacylglucosamine hydrolase